MDLRTGRWYRTKDEALQAGVPETDIAEVVGERDGVPEVRFTPCKGLLPTRRRRKGPSGAAQAAVGSR